MFKVDVGESWVKWTWTRSTPSIEVPALWPMTLRELHSFSNDPKTLIPKDSARGRGFLEVLKGKTYSGAPHD
jgi:hypothetical protein